MCKDRGDKVNRQQRRKLIKNGVTADDLKLLHETTKANSIKFSTDAFAVATCMVLHDKFGFGEVRLKRAVNYITEQFEAITENYVKLGDMKKVLLEECKIKF